MTSIKKSVKIAQGKTAQPDESKEKASTKTVKTEEAVAKGKVDKVNAAKVANDLALNSRTKYIYPADCDTPAKRKQYRAKFRKGLATAQLELKKLNKKTDAESLARTKELEATIAKLKTTRSDMK